MDVRQKIFPSLKGNYTVKGPMTQSASVKSLNSWCISLQYIWLKTTPNPSDAEPSCTYLPLHIIHSSTNYNNFIIIFSPFSTTIFFNNILILSIILFYQHILSFLLPISSFILTKFSFNFQNLVPSQHLLCGPPYIQTTSGNCFKMTSHTVCYPNFQPYFFIYKMFIFLLFIFILPID